MDIASPVMDRPSDDAFTTPTFNWLVQVDHMAWLKKVRKYDIFSESHTSIRLEEESTATRGKQVEYLCQTEIETKAKTKTRKQKQIKKNSSFSMLLL